MMDSEDEDDQKRLAPAKVVTNFNPRGGFSNRAQIGYACSVFELLFSLPLFVDWLGKTLAASGPIRKSLAELYKTLLNTKVVDAEQIISCIGCYESVSHDGDAHLFLSDVLHALDEEGSNIEEIFGGTLKVTEKCSECGRVNVENHDNMVYPVYLDSNDSIQQGTNEYDTVQVIPCDTCEGDVEITQTISYAANILILKVEDVVGAPCIDLTLSFGGCSYELGGLIIRNAIHFETISRSGPYWFKYNDSSVRPIKVGQLLVNDDIKRNVYLAVYSKVLDQNENTGHLKKSTNNTKESGGHENIQLTAQPSKITDDLENGNNDLEDIFSSPPEQPETVAPHNLENGDKLVGDIFLDPEPPKNVEAVTPQNLNNKTIWSPSTPQDLTNQLAAAEAWKQLETFDPLLTEEDVPGAILPYPVDMSASKADLVRWLKCRGAAVANLNKSELIERVNIRMKNKTKFKIDPSIDNFKWYNAKKKAIEEQNPTNKPPFLPLTGWKAFPSVDIPELFNWGHAHVYLIETAPNWSTAFDFSDDEDMCFSQDIAHNVGQTNIPKKGKRFLDSGHIIEVMDCKTNEYYFMKARIQASMNSNVYFTTVTIRITSGSVRDSSCYCKQRSLGRCSHVAALLMYISQHIEEKGYEAISCTSRPCSWGQGSKEKDPGLITKIYKSTTNPLRSRFNPMPTAEQFKTDEELVSIKDNFLYSVQRLYVTEPTLPKKKKKTKGKATEKKGQDKATEKKSQDKGKATKTTEEETVGTTGEEEKAAKPAEEEEEEDLGEYIFDLHLEFVYEHYQESTDNMKNVIQKCKNFARERFALSQKGPIELTSTTGQAKCSTWHSLRSRYFTSSIAKRVFHMTPNGYKGFLREHLWQMRKFKGNKATTYGTNNESTARQAYELLLKGKDPLVKINQSAMWINSRHPELSCSPDGIIHWDSGERELLEIKCPLLLKTGDPNSFETTLSKKQIKRFCLYQENGKLKLKRDHPYYYQIQVAMGVTEIQKCHFVVWSPKGIFYEEVKFHATFFSNIKKKVGPLFWKLLVPEYFFMRTPRKMDPCMLHYIP